jgi:hypothetical protein
MRGKISTEMIDRVAMLVGRMTPAQRERLLVLSPDLRRDALAHAKVQADLADYFEGRMREALSKDFVYASSPEEKRDVPFLGPYTLDEFCALPEDEQIRLWDQAHAQAWDELCGVECPIKSDAVSA